MRLTLLCLLFLTSCSLNKIIIGFASPIVDGGIEALFSEEDDEFAKDAIAGQLKLLEGFLVSSPDDEGLLTNASMGFAAYSIGFIEDVNPERAKNFYLRAREYGLRVLRQNSDFKEFETAKVMEFEAMLSTFEKDDVPPLFWTAISWGLWINLSMDNPRALAQLPRVEAMMRRVQLLEPSYFGGGADLFFGVIECVKPAFIGGDKEKGLKHFKAAMNYSNGEFQLVKAFMAQYYATASLDEDLFDQWVKEVLESKKSKNPLNNLPNALAKRKVKFLMTQKDDLF
jgi:hypothetical protein